MARKTVNVEAVKAHANLMLSLVDGPASPASSPEFSREFRRGIISMVERVLHDTDNYKGFQYLDTEFVREELPGGSRRVLREDYDATRVRYY